MTTKLGVRWSVKPPLLSGQPKEILRANRVIEQIEDINRGLVAYYNDDGKSAATWQDMVNYPNGKNNGTIYGATTPPPATPQALGYLFDGVDDYVDAGIDASLGFSNNFTAIVWSNETNVDDNYRMIIDKTDFSAGFKGWNIFRMKTSLGGKMRFEILTGVDTTVQIFSNSAMTTGWHQIVVTMSSGELKMYVDDVLQTDQKSGTMTSANTTHLLISTSSYPFQGSIDEVRIYNRALSAGEITKLFNATRGKFGI